MKALHRTVSLFFALVLGVLTPLAVFASDDGPEWRGLVESHPAGGHVGTWVIGGKTFEATTTTRFEYEYTHPDMGSIIGMCVEVSYYVSGTSNIATEVDQAEPYECNTTLPPDDDGTYDDGTYDDGTYDDGTYDDGTYDDGTYDDGTYDDGTYDDGTYDDGTYDDGTYDDGTYDDGTYDDYDNDGDDNGDYDNDGDDNGDYDDDGDHDDDYDDYPKRTDGSGGKFYGVVSVIPTGYVGAWTIGGEMFTSTPSTDLDFEPEHEYEREYEHDYEYGTIEAGVCVEVEYTVINGVKTALDIERTAPYKCSNGTETNRAYGTVLSLPTTMTGAWVIQTTRAMSITIDVTDMTRIDQEYGTFAAGDCVKVVYAIQRGTATALYVEREEGGEYCRAHHEYNDDDDDVYDDGRPRAPYVPDYTRVYGTIDQMPDTLQGEWLIGGTSYVSTGTTRFEQSDGTFAPGACVKAAYTVEQGVNTLLKIETEEAYKCDDTLDTDDGSQYRLLKSYGAVESLPISNTMLGAWQVGGITYTVTSTTRLKQEHGFFGVGAYVEVKYYNAQGSRVAVSIETHVAPRAGTHRTMGRFRGAARQGDQETWVIGDKTYYCDPAMEVETGDDQNDDNDGTQLSAALAQAAPSTGDMVMVNYYEDADGNAYLTYASTAQISQTYLPLLMR